MVSQGKMLILQKFAHLETPFPSTWGRTRTAAWVQHACPSAGALQHWHTDTGVRKPRKAVPS